MLRGPVRQADITNNVVGTVEGGNLVLREERGWVWRPPEFEASDSRLSGRYLLYVNTERYVTPDGEIDDSPWLDSIVVRIENEGGAWQGTGFSGSWPNDPRGVSWEPSILRGEGDYAGLTTLWLDRFSEDPCGWEVKGVVFDGELAPLPELPTN